jgi:hypothetical protein
MTTETPKSYAKTPSKLRRLWDIAMILIGSYEDFERRLTDAEKKMEENSAKLANLANRANNV